MEVQDMFEQIVLAVDASDDSRRAIRIATDIAKRYGSRVTVLHAVVTNTASCSRARPPRKRTTSWTRL
jgi:nucleotide-binding universal stress UspA family protein